MRPKVVVSLVVACLTLVSDACLSIARAAPTPAPRAAQLEFTVNEQFLVPWGYENLGYSIKSFQPGLRVDLYLALLQGGAECIAPEMIFTSPPPASASDLALSDSQTVITEGYLPAQLPLRTMTVYGVLVPHGVSPADSANWVSNLAALDLATGTLSSAQRDVLAARGNPQTYLIQFFHDTQQRLETWMYDGGGRGQVFQFINGRPLSNEQGGERARAKVASPPTVYGPGRFAPGTTPGEIRALLGDPDRVIRDSPGIQVWIFKGSRMSVTVKNGVVLQIAAH